MRKYKRAIAKARMKACGIERINRKMGRRTWNGKTLWREFITGKFAEQARRAQIRPKLKRKIRRISPVTG